MIIIIIIIMVNSSSNDKYSMKRTRDPSGAEPPGASPSTGAEDRTLKIVDLSLSLSLYIYIYIYITPQKSSWIFSGALKWTKWYFPTGLRFSAAFSKGLSLPQWIFTGIDQWTFSSIFQWTFTFVVSGTPNPKP